MFIKVVLFYFAFSAIRRLVRSFSQVSAPKDSSKDQTKDTRRQHKKSSDATKGKGEEEDIVEAEFRRL